MTLDAIKARRDAATPGPWELREAAAFVRIEMPEPDTDPSFVYAEHCYGLIPPGIIHRDDADFIAHSRTDIDKLITVAEAAKVAEVALHMTGRNGPVYEMLKDALDALERDE